MLSGVLLRINENIYFFQYWFFDDITNLEWRTIYIGLTRPRLSGISWLRFLWKVSFTKPHHWSMDRVEIEELEYYNWFRMIMFFLKHNLSVTRYTQCYFSSRTHARTVNIFSVPFDLSMIKKPSVIFHVVELSLFSYKLP